MTAVRHLDREVLNGKRILVVDDVSDNRLLESLFLRRMGAEVEFAINGLEAIKKASEGDHDAILMDLHMPVLDGIRATSRLRNEGYTKPIIAVTADGQQAMRRLAFEVGFDDYIAKPMTMLQLMHSLNRFCKSDD